jgi:hypothetical protein
VRPKIAVGAGIEPGVPTIPSLRRTANWNASALLGVMLAIWFAFTGAAWASPGCSQFGGSITVASTGSITSQTGSTFGTGFSAGDTVSFTATGVTADMFANSVYIPRGASGSYTFPADAPAAAVFILTIYGPPGTLTWSCTPAFVPPTGPTNSQILEQTRQTFSKIGAQTSAVAMSDATSGAIGDAFSGGGTTQIGNGTFSTNFAAIENARDAESDKKRDPFESFATLGYAKAPYMKPPPRLQSPWHVWIDGRFTGFEDKSPASFDGWHNNVTAGASYRVTESFLAGVLVGYENFKYSMAVVGVPASLNGNGTSGGGYFGWKIYDRLRLDGMLTYGRIDYGATAGPVSGSFGADRITGMSKLSGRYAFGTFWLEPSAMLTIASERQDSFTDSAAVFHDKFNFTVGRASTGGAIGIPLAWGQCIVTPTFGAFGDYRFGDQTAAAISSVPTFNNGWSAHVNGGLSIAMPNNITASATGEYGGLGDQIQYWRAKGSLGVKF